MWHLDCIEGNMRAAELGKKGCDLVETYNAGQRVGDGCCGRNELSFEQASLLVQTDCCLFLVAALFSSLSDAVDNDTAGF